MEHERGSSKHLRELERRDAVKHGHERPTEEDYDTVDFTPAEGRMLIRFFEDFGYQDAKRRFASDVEALLMLRAIDKLSSGLRAAGY